MRTTVRLNKALTERARQEYPREVALTSLKEHGLQLVLRRPHERRERPAVVLPERKAGEGTLPGVDLDGNAALLDRMEDHA